ncbi:hypothetical protein [Paractinoplanes hotanensis]|uniref:Uncharacterized protein n=1 Tax=Paractinoplanes hotanensis TaxID=2906497 RepID=A0ABT0Y578_9ACTN|nr:hypothetical protein [Actinoplanes hotanensis]MCM4081015.1 hypothetical protein [Actinoplanes hotanensis]
MTYYSFFASFVLGLLAVRVLVDLLVLVGLGLLVALGAGTAQDARWSLRAGLTEANPAYLLVAGSVGLLVFLNAINQLFLFAAALTATSTAGHPFDLAVEDEGNSGTADDCRASVQGRPVESGPGAQRP